jgi:hypothetical protein
MFQGHNGHAPKKELHFARSLLTIHFARNKLQIARLFTPGTYIMPNRGFDSLKAVILFGAAFSLMTPQVLAGGSVKAGKSNSRHPVAAAPTNRAVAPATVSVSLAVAAPSQQSATPGSVNLRGPDGRIRRFAVEGGPNAIQFQPVVVLRSGQTLTIQWVARK